MILHQGMYLPAGEKHLVEWMTTHGEVVDGHGTYQIKKLRVALDHCKQFRTAVDIGAHVGLWSRQLINRFDELHAFEPVAEHRECFKENIPNIAPFEGNHEAKGCETYLHACALGDKEGRIKILTEAKSSGNSRVNGDGNIPMHMLDSFALHDVDFIKIDTEGYEFNICKGAQETIMRCRPTMIVEQKGHGTKHYGIRKEQAVELLESWGMKRAVEMAGDWVMVWP